ncbi:TPA: hypothetical protein DCF80_01070 [Candidatus Saccharibacteria bacterium]|nr:hypothetical protein [Candidatus Saccharibacteria bacterium]
MACFLTEDPQIDGGLRPYLERHGLVVLGYKPDEVGSQMFTVCCTSDDSQCVILELLEAYYVSWGKEPSVKHIDQIIS